MALENNQLELVVRNHYDDVYRFARSLSPIEADAADLTQQAFLRYAAKGNQIRDTSKVKSWLFTVLRNEFLDMQRKKNRYPQVQIEVIRDDSLVQESAGKAVDKRSAIAALHSLPIKYREPLALYFLEGFTYQEIANILEIPTGTVMSRLARGKVRLREIFTGSSIYSQKVGA